MTKPKFDIVPTKQTFQEIRAEFNAKRAADTQKEAVDLGAVVLDQFRCQLSDAILEYHGSVRLEHEYLRKPHVKENVQDTLEKLGYKCSFSKEVEDKRCYNGGMISEAYLTVWLK